MEKYAVIMAGGAGSRLWPLSREGRPKQFIPAQDGKCMLIQTIERLGAIVPPENCFIVTSKTLLGITSDTVEGHIPASNIITEPMRKNTAACITYAALMINDRFGPGLLCYVPADGYVKNTAEYRRALARAFAAAEKTGDLVVIGIAPGYPATGYGYIRVDKQSGEDVFKIRGFTEKPDAATAKEFVASGEYLWNSGIVVGSTETLTENVRRHLPDHFDILSRAVGHRCEEDFSSGLEKAYQALESTSFDTGVLEKSTGIRAVRGGFDWDDIGSLDALAAKTFTKDKDDNYVKGSHVGVATRGCVIYGGGVPIATVGVENMIVASVNDTVLVCSKDAVQEIKLLVEKLKSGGFEQLL